MSDRPTDIAHAGLIVQDVSHAWGPRAAVSRLSLDARPGELVCLVGPSGCGKSTVLRIAAGLEPIQSGRILLGGAVLAEPGRDTPPEARGVGLVFQDVALFPHLTVADNVGFGLRRMAAGVRRGRVSELLAQVHLSEYAASYPHELSGGQQQRVALARALAPRPRAMLLDEPFSGLDARLRSAVRDEALHVLKTSGASVVVVTHDPEEAMFMADRIAVMRGGRIEQVGAPDEIYLRPASEFVAEFFGEVNRINGRVDGGSVATPFGSLAAPEGLREGQPVHVLIRPEALRIEGAAPRSGQDGRTVGAVSARVLASRLLGRTSWVHLCLNTDPTHRHDEPGGGGTEHHSHWHARAPGRFLPSEGQLLTVALDPTQSFVFPTGTPT